MKIEDLLSSRTDLSTFLVHLTRSANDKSAKDVLKQIISDDKIIAGSPYGIAAKKLQDKRLSTESQKVVCFTETPMEHLSLLTGEIENRGCKFEPYGLAFTRKQCRKMGVNPVWYVDITPGHFWLTNPLNNMVDIAIEAGEFDKSDISKISPFVEQMGAGETDAGGRIRGYKKEFWWEREWRHVGDFYLPNTYIILCPTEDMRELKNHVFDLKEGKCTSVSFIDPSWSLEYIIGKLAGFSGDELGSF